MRKRKTVKGFKKIRNEVFSVGGKRIYKLTHKVVSQYLRCLQEFGSTKYIFREDIEKVLKKMEEEGLFSVGNVRDFLATLNRFDLVEIVETETDRRRKLYKFKKPEGIIKEEIQKVIGEVENEIKELEERARKLRKTLQGKDLID